MVKKQKKEQKKNRKKLFIILGVVLGVILLIFAIRTYNLSHATQQYSDRDNNFAITLPAKWITKEVTSVATTGLGTAEEKKHPIEISSFYTPDGVGINIQVYREQQSCEKHKTPNAKISDIPAFYNQDLRMWTIDTTDATYVINYAYPGLNIGYGSARRNRMPVSSEQMDSYQQTIDSILSTFQPTSRQPLSC